MKLIDLIYEKTGSVAVATINRPDRLNAFRAQTYQELREILQDARVDERIRTLIITGTGRAFCAGEDLKELSGVLTGTPSIKESLHGLKALQDITRQIVQHPKIVIAA